MPPKARRPKRGDIWHLDFTPAAGTEMLMRHFALVLSHNDYNSNVPRAYVAPISTTATVARNTGFQVNLTGAGMRTTGVVDLTQVRAVDMQARNGTFIEAAPEFIIDEALARFAVIFGD
jgi:mRNA-degrading endonuclease toxin of MazEF toxin-antitoxin module